MVDYSIAYGMMEGTSDRFGNADSALSTDRSNATADTAQNSGAANHSEYGNILFLDGHVKGFPTDKWMTNSGINQHLNPTQKDATGTSW
jgi:prepilin-type processing-associated H-X9-DG protein